ncbi:hypothetical protein [Bradyrhizobium cenepequi]
MRKLILISAFVLAASMSAQAGQSRGLVLASNDDQAASAKVEAVKPVEAQPTATVQPDAQPVAATQAAAAPTESAKAETPKAETKTHAAKPSKKTHAHSWRDDEAKARRIAAKYGVYW